jgi:hypothetical protein
MVGTCNTLETRKEHQLVFSIRRVGIVASRSKIRYIALPERPAEEEKSMDDRLIEAANAAARELLQANHVHGHGHVRVRVPKDWPVQQGVGVSSSPGKQSIRASTGFVSINFCKNGGAK